MKDMRGIHTGYIEIHKHSRNLYNYPKDMEKYIIYIEVQK